MKLTWNGHSCFTFDTDLGTVVFDPYETDYVPGLHLPDLAADMVLCSHDHNDHCYPEGVRNTRRAVGFATEIVNTFHDGQGGIQARIARTDGQPTDQVSFLNVHTVPFDPPQTGDEENLLLWMALCGISAMCVLCLLRSKKNTSCQVK